LGEIKVKFGKSGLDLGKIEAKFGQIKILHPQKHSVSYGYGYITIDAPFNLSLRFQEKIN